MNPPKSSPAETVPVEKLSYEAALSELEALVLNLESDEHALADALAMFERGQALTRHCAQLLEDAQIKIQELSGEELVEFDPSYPTSK
jgi:exodeoxyribonuclease VII small subunit